ncbi:hypothetical protein [Pelagibius sp. Alg239-R121]|uniref:hypothetical protein n=1 Tax=Pelagibius sp. Alg239-R121 TaxID=2993448 RepID=UPI0024A673A9|nr:hypothetical protein [Pelagibius sp. Alg239-R121]
MKRMLAQRPLIWATAVAISLLSASVQAGDKLKNSVSTGFKNAEALAVDPATGILYISVVGDLNGDDGDGFIAKTGLNKLDPVIFIDGLNGPKGSQIVNGQMYVVEANAILIIDLETMAARTIELPEAGFLLDLAVNDGGEIFVTDPPNNAVYKISKSGTETFIQDAQLAYPNGIKVMANGDLLVASWGVVSDESTWATSESGRIVRISTDGKIVLRTEPLANLDGIELSNGQYIAAGFNDGVLYSFDPHTGKVSNVGKISEGLADIAFYGKRMYSINFNSSELAVQQIR